MQKTSGLFSVLLAAGVMIVSLPLVSVSQQNTSLNQQSPAAATLKEHTDWLKEKLVKHLNSFELKDNRLVKAERAKFDGCKLTFLEIENWDVPGQGRSSAQREVTVNLKDINSSKVTVFTYHEHPSVVLETKDRKPKIDVQFVAPGIGPKKQLELYVLRFRDKAIAMEVAQRFAEAVRLCQ